MPDSQFNQYAQRLKATCSCQFLTVTFLGFANITLWVHRPNGKLRLLDGSDRTRA
jgi:hypothetical protein